jgi:C4-dicarboxylate transporter DctM subunit
MNALRESIPVLVLPIIILGGIYGGVFTPTEAAAVAALYACLASLSLGDFTPKDLPGIFMGTCKTSAQLMVIIAASCAFAQAAIVAQIPSRIASLFEETNRFEFLIILNMVLIVVGCLFETGSAILILAPLILPTALEMGIDPVHLGIVFTVNLAIGMFTPPFGLNIYVVQGIFGKGMGEISAACVPFIILYFGTCLILTYVPWISLFLPKLLL